MKLLKSSLIVLESVGLIFLGACSNSNQAANLGSSLAVSTSKNTAKTEPHSEKFHKGKKNQVIESGKYHLEFVAEPKNKETNLDFHFERQKNKIPISNANVTAQIQMPDGTQKTLKLPYDAEGKHYAALLPGKISGEYKVSILVDINSAKVNGRFSFNR